MGTLSFSADVDVVAAAAGSFSQQVAGAAVSAMQLNGFDVGNTIKYNLNRLRGLQLITPEEQEQLGQLADVLESKNDMSGLIETIQQSSDASPVAIALAGITASMPASDLAAAAEALSAAIVGTLLMSVANPLFGDKPGDAGAGKVLAGVLAAIGAAAASMTSACAQKRTRS